MRITAVVATCTYFAETVIGSKFVQLGSVSVLDRAIPAKIILLGLCIEVLLGRQLVLSARIRLYFARRLVGSFQDLA